MEIRYQNNFLPLKDIRAVNLNKEDAEKLAICLNHWSDDDSWGGSFGNVEWTTERVHNDWFVNLKFIEQFVVDKDNQIHGYVSLDNHYEDEDANYVPTLGVIPSSQRKGYGKALLFSALKKTIKMGKRRLDLHTWAGNLRSVPVYKKTGFFWRKNTSVLMENYLPAVLSTQLFDEFFTENDFYDSREIDFSQNEDNFKHKSMQAYFYRFIKDDSNSITVYIDSHAKELSGFIYQSNNKMLSVQLIPNKHEIFLSIDKTSAVLQIKNNWSVPINIKGNIQHFKGIKDITPKEIDILIEPDDEISIDIVATIDPDVETYLPSQETQNRTDSRFTIQFEINGKKCMLGCGWVPKDPILLKLLRRSVDFGKYQDKKVLPIGFRNLTPKTMIGELKITGDGLIESHIVNFKLDSNSAMETSVVIHKPSKPTSASWKWDLDFIIKNGEDYLSLQPLFTHISCFSASGVVAYLNSKPKKECIIENEHLSFRFEYNPKEWDGLRAIYAKGIEKEIFTRALGIVIGKPFPEESSEFWKMENHYKIINKDNGIILKQEFISKTEKPGLKIIRWIELDAGKKFITTYFDLMNTNEKKIIKNASLLNMNWDVQCFSNSGYFLVPSKQGFLTLNHPEFIDEYDFPNKPEDFSEPWIAYESNNEQDLGFGVIWDPSEIIKIQYSSHHGPNIEYKSYDLNPGEIIRTGHYTLVVGQIASRLTRRIWLTEFNGEKSPNSGNNLIDYSNKILDFRCGEELQIPGLEQNIFLKVDLIDSGCNEIETQIIYKAKRETPLEIKTELKSKLWGNIQQQTHLLEKDKPCISILPVENKIRSIFPILIKGDIILPHYKKKYSSICLPYNNNSEVKLEKEDNFWSFSNEFFKFKTSNTHGASLFSVEIANSDELFFSRFPSNESFVWFKKFIGGLHPFVSVPGDREDRDFYIQKWSKPHLIKKHGWYRLQFSLKSAENDIRLKNISYLMTYYTRSECPMIWASLEMKNNSKMTNTIDSYISLYSKPIELIHFTRNNENIAGMKTNHDKYIVIESPNNSAILDWGENKLKAFFFAINPQSTVRGDFSNANNYSEINSYERFTLKPGETRRQDVVLIFSDDLNVLKAIKQTKPIIRI